MGRFDRRSFLQMGAGTAVGAAVLGATGGELEAVAASAAKPKMGGQLNVGIIAEINGLSPISSQMTTAGLYYGRAMFDPIAIVASDGTVKPYLCQSITPNADATTWTFKLRPGISFHDGTPLDSSALANHFQHILKSPASSRSTR